MGELAIRQKQLWALICDHADCLPMLRISRTDDCYWVCDLPRRTTKTAPAKNALQAAGYLLWEEEALHLWKIDLPENDPLYHMDKQDVAFPQKEEKLPLYALWRMLAAHPSPLAQQSKPLLRKILKLCEMPAAEQEHAAKQITAECAALINRKQSLPSAAVGVLAMIMIKEEE